MFDRLLFVVSGKLREADEAVYAEAVRRVGGVGRLLPVRSFAESLDDAEREDVRNDFRQRLGKEPTFLSNRFGEGLKEVRSFLE